MEKPKIFTYLPEITKDIFKSLMDYIQNYDFTWLIQYITENFTPEELYGEEYMENWIENKELYYKKITGVSRRQGMELLGEKSINYLLRNEWRLKGRTEDGKYIEYLIYSNDLHQGWIIDFRLDKYDRMDKFKNIYVVTVLPINAQEVREQPGKKTIKVVLP